MLEYNLAVILDKCPQRRRRTGLHGTHNYRLKMKKHHRQDQMMPLDG